MKRIAYICSVPGCGGKYLAKGLCAGHYQRRRKGTALPDSAPISKSENRKGALNPNWNGGEAMDGGRMKIHRPDHPHATKQGYVYRYRLVMEEKLGRYLTDSEIVHHKDNDESNDAPDNLEVKPQGEHVADHRDQMVKARIDKHSKIKTDDLPDIIKRRSGGEKLASIAKDYGVNEGAISVIARGIRRRKF